MSDPVRITVCTDAEAVRWDEFLGAQNSGSFYHRFAWKDINEQNFGHQTFFLTAQRAPDRIFPLVLVSSRLFGRILCSMPFVNYGGPCSSDPEAMTLLLDEMVALASRLRADYAEIRTLEPLAREFPSALHKVSMTIALQPDPDTLWNAFTSKHRTNIRRIYKNGLHVVSGHLDQLDTFYDVLAESWRQHGTPIYRRRYFADILAAFPHETRIFVAYQDKTGLPRSAVISGYREACKDRRRYRRQATCCTEVIRTCERGFAHYHLGRSTVESGTIFQKSGRDNGAVLALLHALANRCRNSMSIIRASAWRSRCGAAYRRALPRSLARRSPKAYPERHAVR
jgi:FemAB-related protein (PEP-CTERM system-associated)